jgi:hypothetical protein
MNLRVDLILESEQRSASMFNLKSLLRLVVIAIPSSIIALFLFSSIGLMSLKRDVKLLQDENEIKQPKVTRADALSVEVAKNESMSKELAGWHNSALDWHTQLVAIMKATPEEMYFETLRASHAFQTENNIPARTFSIVMTGKSKGKYSEDNVLKMKRTLTISDFFAIYMDPPKVPVFKQDPSAKAKDSDRIFRIECSYKPRKME